MPVMLQLAAENPLLHVVDYDINGGPLTIHIVSMVVASVLLVLVMLLAARSIGTGPAALGNERFIAKGGLAQMIEVIVVYMRDNVVRPQLGEAGDKFLPFLLTIFFFILANNLLGLVPLMDIQHLFGVHHLFIGGTATGNIAVTGALALIAFIVIQINGLRASGIGGWAKHFLGGAPIYLAPIMVPVEILGTFIKPFALAVRLFANMTAGHTLLATLLMFTAMGLQGLGVLWGSPITAVSVVASIAIMFLELFVAFLQAFVFMFLTTVFIAQLSHHHDEHEEDHEHLHPAAQGHAHAPGHGVHA